MSSGQCLCGAVNWRITGKPEAAYNCHCSMCRKAHGAAFGSYYLVKVDDFEWTGSTDTISGYASSPELTRTFCNVCGSAVPENSISADDDSGDPYVYVPAGCHDEGEKMQEHIFAGHKAPWHDITDNLPQHEDYPPGVEETVYENKAAPDAPSGVLRGSCLCDAVQFQVIEPFKIIHNCHCSRCRRARAAAHTTNGVVSLDGVRFVKGEEHLVNYQPLEAKFFTHTFCGTCGSGMPRKDPGRKITIVPLGALDDDPGVKADDHVFIGSKAAWFDITDGLPAYEEMPPPT